MKPSIYLSIFPAFLATCKSISSECKTKKKRSERRGGEKAERLEVPAEAGKEGYEVRVL